MESRTPQLSVIVPAHNASSVLAESLPALAASDLPRASWELIVVDDASTDDSAALAERYADQVIRLSGAPRGPAYARNRGCEAARSDIMVFIDADVCVHATTLRELLRELVEAPDAAAVFGAYDTTPRSRGVVSQYRNLLHHYIHALNGGDADTFWSGCGAMRRKPFYEAGGFDEQRYPRPQIEDIALGYRVRALGYRLLLRPQIQATHLKRWTLLGMVKNDLLDRGVPWMRLLLAGEAAGNGSLNVRPSEKVITGLAGVSISALIAAPFLGKSMLAAGTLLLLIVVAVNIRFFAWCARLRGVSFALAVVPLHVLHYVVNATAVAFATARYLLRPSARSGGPSPLAPADHTRRDDLAPDAPAERHAR
jgi:hypothetical protein